MPMPPTMTRSLGATVPSRPSAELGMIVGAAIAALAAESAVFKIRRRSNRVTFFDILALPEWNDRQPRRSRRSVPPNADSIAPAACCFYIPRPAIRSSFDPPNSGGSITPAGSKQLPVLIEGDRVHGRPVAQISCQELARLRVPHAHGAIRASRGNLFTARRESQRPNIAALSVPGVQELSARPIPNPNRPIPTT